FVKMGSMTGNEFCPEIAADETWKALLGAEVFTEGDFVFASGKKATLKVEMDKLYSKPKQLAVILGHFAIHPVVQEADVLLYVPDGMRKFTETLGNELNKTVAHSMKTPDSASRYDFGFASKEDGELALSARNPVICEDVVTTLGSVAGMRRLLPPEQTVASLAILLRGTVNPEYKAGLDDHYLLTREIPTCKNEFREMMKKLRS
ncbi:hypothetical protein KA068_02105, partial [Candidatus Saccharibacteria bacterium]|nr:hypothetical protein [Candidatus Saccharibacteria bacterium]